MSPDIPRVRVVTLSNAVTVRIHDDEWRITTSGTWNQGALEFQARRGFLFVRQHADGRVLVYGGLNTRWTSEHNLRAGEIVSPREGDALTTSNDVVEAIMRTALALGATERFARDIIARLPPVEI